MEDLKVVWDDKGRGVCSGCGEDAVLTLRCVLESNISSAQHPDGPPGFPVEGVQLATVKELLDIPVHSCPACGTLRFDGDKTESQQDIWDREDGIRYD